MNWEKAFRTLAGKVEDHTNIPLSIIEGIEMDVEAKSIVNPDPPPKDGTVIFATLEVAAPKFGTLPIYKRMPIFWRLGTWITEGGTPLVAWKYHLIHWQSVPDLDKIIEANKRSEE